MSSLIDMDMNNEIVSPNIHQQHHYHLQQQQQQKRNKKKNKKRKLMTVDEFGNLWLAYTNEGKTILTIPKSIQQELNINQKNQQMTMINIVNWLKEEWGINIIQIVNEECLANYDSSFYDDDNENHSILIHLQLNHSKTSTYQLHVTLRSMHRHSLKLFSQAYQIELFL
ncbi:hypothetical protein BJ944DRAFT_242783 [Cunninghamella echinulata]|nr:hypothetical protein BJ944DRAFT_242783 [Cunninghamella echinulata]